MKDDINMSVQPEISTREPEFIIQPTKGWGSLRLGELWRQRYLVWVLTSREIKGRYRQMALGPLWIVINPFINMVIYSIIFGYLANLPSEGLPYPLFAYTALLPWTYFSAATSKSVNSLRGSMGLITKVYFNRLIIPVSAVFSSLVDLGINFVVLLATMAYFGFQLSLKVLVLPLFILLATIISLTVGLWTSALSVRFRDLGFAVGHFLRVWMYATPVAYSATLIPENFQSLYQLNPMYWVIEGFRWALLGTELTVGYTLYISLGVILLSFIFGAFVFRRTERTIVDIF